MVQMIAVRVTTAKQLMHRKLEGRSNSGTRPPQKLRTSQNLEGSGDIKGGIDICHRGKPGQASAAAMHCLAEFGLYYDLQMTPQDSAAGGTSRHSMPTVEDCAEHNDPVPSERIAA